MVQQSDFEDDSSLEVPATPKWFPLRYADGEPKCGEILVSFAAADMDYNFRTPAQYLDLRSRVEFEEFDINMLVLGLRGL